MKLITVDQVDLRGKKIFVRGDIDVPVSRKAGEQESRIEDDTRLEDIWPTIDYLLKQNCTVLLAGHLGRPGGIEKPELSSKPVALWFRQRMSNGQSSMSNQFSNGTMEQLNNEVSGFCLKGQICGFLVNEKLVVLENLRFDPREEANDEGYAKELASLGEIYVNESFAESYREVASIVGVPKFLPHYAGFWLAKEVEVLNGVLENPKRPLLVIIGGAKLDTKLPVIAKMAKFADQIIVGGKLLEDLEKNHSLEKNDSLLILELTSDKKDTTLESIDGIKDSIQEAGTIVWNGPLGKTEEEDSRLGTSRLVEMIVANAEAYKVVGGGDTVAFLDTVGLTGKFDWVCSGGGAMLTFLSGERLPGIEALLIN